MDQGQVIWDLKVNDIFTISLSFSRQKKKVWAAERFQMM